jgi:hypothetical protein
MHKASAGHCAPNSAAQQSTSVRPSARRGAVFRFETRQHPAARRKGSRGRGVRCKQAPRSFTALCCCANLNLKGTTECEPRCAHARVHARQRSAPHWPAPHCPGSRAVRVTRHARDTRAAQRRAQSGTTQPPQRRSTAVQPRLAQPPCVSPKCPHALRGPRRRHRRHRRGASVQSAVTFTPSEHPFTHASLVSRRWRWQEAPRPRHAATGALHTAAWPGGLPRQVSWLSHYGLLKDASLPSHPSRGALLGTWPRAATRAGNGRSAAARALFPLVTSPLTRAHGMQSAPVKVRVLTSMRGWAHACARVARPSSCAARPPQGPPHSAREDPKPNARHAHAAFARGHRSHPAPYARAYAPMHGCT